MRLSWTVLAHHLIGPFIETNISKPSETHVTQVLGEFKHRTLNVINIIGSGSSATSAHLKVVYQQIPLRCDRLEHCISLTSGKRQTDLICGPIS